MRIKIATDADVDQIRSLMDLAINLLQIPYLTTDQITASHKGMGLDRQLIRMAPIIAFGRMAVS